MSSAWPLNGHLRDDLQIKKLASRYTPSQICQWLAYIEFPTALSEDDLSSGVFPTTLENLTIVNRLHLVKCPYENTSMHYTETHDMDIGVESLFKRIVEDRKGSYCFGNNIFFLEALRGLGYRVYSGAGRVNESDDPVGTATDYTSFSHMVLFVQPEDGLVTYVVDAAGGSMGPARPILLSSSPNNIAMGISSTENHRLTRGSRINSSFESPAEVDWRVEVLHTGKESKVPTWKIIYTFTEVEFFEKDYQAANFAVSKMTHTFFADKIIFSKHFWLSYEEAKSMGQDESEMESPATKYIGRIGVNGAVFSKHIGPKTELLCTAKTERERIEALKKFCGFDISMDAVGYIQGSLASLPCDG